MAIPSGDAASEADPNALVGVNDYMMADAASDIRDPTLSQIFRTPHAPGAVPARAAIVRGSKPLP